jgi:hypothetical protein
MPDVLSSDILESQFGPTEVEVLYQDEKTRIICTKAVGSGQVLEVSRVSFAPDAAAKFPDAHQAVLSGKSIGKAFREANIEFRREVRAAYKCVLPESFEKLFGGPDAATIVYVSILAGSGQIPYCRILETFSPDVKWPQLSGEPDGTQLEQIGLLDQFLINRGKTS